jgi:hypothetical protein
VLSPTERAELNENVNQSLANARRMLASSSASGGPQAETVRLVKTFISQAERARGEDLTLAMQLARRAEVLAQSLAR